MYCIACVQIRKDSKRSHCMCALRQTTQNVRYDSRTVFLLFGNRAGLRSYHHNVPIFISYAKRSDCQSQNCKSTILATTNPKQKSVLVSSNISVETQILYCSADIISRKDAVLFSNGFRLQLENV